MFLIDRETRARNWIVGLMAVLLTLLAPNVRGQAFSISLDHVDGKLDATTLDVDTPIKFYIRFTNPSAGNTSNIIIAFPGIGTEKPADNSRPLDLKHF